MAVVIEHRYSAAIHPLHAVLLAGAVPLFLGATLSDAAYVSSYHIQWNNFASWLMVGGLVLTGLALIFVIIDLFRPAYRRARGFGLYALLMLATFIVGFFNALMHARDAWASMPGGLVLSVITTILVCVATWLGFSARRVREI